MIAKYLDVGGILPAQEEEEMNVIDDSLLALAPPKIKAHRLVEDALSLKYSDAVLHLLPAVINLLLGKQPLMLEESIRIPTMGCLGTLYP